MKTATIIDSHLREQNGFGRFSLTAQGFVFRVRGSRIKATFHSRWLGTRDGVELTTTDADLARRLCDGLSREELAELQSDLCDIPDRRGAKGWAGGALWRVLSTGWIVR